MSVVQVPTKVRNLAIQFHRAMICAFAFTSIWSTGAFAQTNHPHTASSQTLTDDQKNNQSALIKIVRDSTERFQDVAEAVREGYTLQFGCVSGPDQGAMGLHFVNSDLVSRGIIDPTRPQIVIYEPTADGHLKLIGVDFLLIASVWDADKTHTGPPQLMGQLFHYWESPNRFSLPAFYTLHIWAWKENPNGAFVNWHPNVSCHQFNGQAQ
jgi:hypothetical protein